MNLFVTSNCPIECAKYLDDKRVVKMVLETAQMLSTALRECGYEGDDVYRSTHKNHPANVWVRKTRANYNWTVDHFVALALEYEARYGKVHKSLSLLPAFKREAVIIPAGEQTPFANCAANGTLNITFKSFPIYAAYRNYLSYRWSTDKRTPTWFGKQALREAV